MSGPKPFVLALLNTYDYCAWWRVLSPFAELTRHGYVARHCLYQDLADGLDVGEFDLVVTPRLTMPGMHPLAEWLESMRKHGTRWVYEADDDLWSPEFCDVQVELWGLTGTRADRRRLMAQAETMRQQRLRLLRRCDGVTVSTPELARTVCAFAPGVPVTVAPNLIDVAWFERGLRAHNRMVPGLTVGWAGGMRREEDFWPLVSAWSVLAALYPRLTFVVYGAEPASLCQAVPSDQLALVEWASIDLYPAGLKNIDIACCILPDSVTNRRKSANKWLEMSLAGIPSVVSPTVYGEVVTPEHDALVATTTEDWVRQLRRLIDDAELRYGIGANARQTVLEQHALSEHWQKWPEAWQTILNC